MIQNRDDALANPIFELSHASWGKPRRNHPSVLIVFGRIQADHWGRRIVQADPRDTSDVLVEHSMSTVLAVGGKQLRSFRHRDNVFVARYLLEPTAVVFGIPGDGRFTPEPCENLMWDAIAVEIRILEVDEGDS